MSLVSYGGTGGMAEWSGLAREEVEELATAYRLTIDRVRTLADEKYPADKNEAEQLFRRASQNVRTALIEDLSQRGCPQEEVESWLVSILQEAERLRSDDNAATIC